MQLFPAAAILTFVLGLATAAPADRRSEAHITATNSPGGPHGDWFDDHDHATTNHKRIAYVTMYGCAPGEHVTMIEVGFRDNLNPDNAIHDVVRHGGHLELKTLSLILKRDEWINAVKTSTWKRKIRYGLAWDVRTRIGNIELFTNKGQSVSCGAFWVDDATETNKGTTDNGALLYFSGRAGDMIDQLQAHWIPKEDF